ncbi:MAG: hypothetical protein ACRENS_04300 [Candidatus Eiseniibacteriota bacterium]
MVVGLFLNTRFAEHTTRQGAGDPALLADPARLSPASCVDMSTYIDVLRASRRDAPPSACSRIAIADTSLGSASPSLPRPVRFVLGQDHPVTGAPEFSINVPTPQEVAMRMRSGTSTSPNFGVSLRSAVCLAVLLRMGLSPGVGVASSPRWRRSKGSDFSSFGDWN